MPLTNIKILIGKDNKSNVEWKKREKILNIRTDVNNPNPGFEPPTTSSIICRTVYSNWSSFLLRWHA